MEFQLAKTIQNNDILRIPTNRQAKPVYVTFHTDNNILLECALCLSDDPDYIVEIPLDAILGKPLIATVPDAINPEHYLFLSEKSAIPAVENLRPRLHFSAPRGFHNDPNGLFFYKGKYHMFYQINPYGLSHGNTAWGHAISEDMINWSHLPDALIPNNIEGDIFSGSAVVDSNNHSGLKQGQEDPILFFYTAIHTRFAKPLQGDKPAFSQHLVYSLDGGFTLQHYGQIIAPITQENRDPKVVFNAQIGIWYMVLYLKENDFLLLSSQNLLSWEQVQPLHLSQSSECPDLFYDAASNKWILYASPENYMVGHFEQGLFRDESGLILGCMQKSGEKPMQFIQAASYAAQTFNNLPDNRIVQLAWVPTIFPGMPFGGCMNIPWDLKLVQTMKGSRLSVLPIAELNKYRKTLTVSSAFGDSPDFPSSDAIDLEIDCTIQPDGSFAISVRGILMEYAHSDKTLLTPIGLYDVPFANDKIDFRIVSDTGCLEIFACQGLFHCTVNIAADPAHRWYTILRQKSCDIAVRAFALEKLL